MARSTLELLLESIKARDEEPSDQPPVLPQRPLSRGRLPVAALRVKKMAAAAGAIASSLHHYGNGEKMLLQTCGPMDPTVNRKEISVQASEPTVSQNHRENAVSVASSVKVITMMEEDLPVEHQLAEFEDTGRTAASRNTPEFHLEFDRDETPQKRMRVEPISGLKKGSNVWYIDKNTNKWTIGTVESHKNMESMIKSSIKNQIISIPHAGMLPANPKVLDGVDDLIHLGFVNEPSVLHNLQVRYTMNNVYTKAGSMLIALNPFEEAQTKTARDVCAFAANVMRALERDRVNQSIILSGESDAGKTELAKLLIQCFNNGKDENSFLFSVLQANRILESLGSAKIQNNPNASFLGKLVNLYMNDLGRMSMVQFHTVLFDESRVVHRVDDEQSYHIFYQLCEGAGQALRDHLKIKSVEDFEYLKGSKLSEKAGSDYYVEFKLLLSAFCCLGFDERDQEFVFSILAAILWIGNIPSRCLTTKDGEVLLEKCEEIENVVGLLKCSREALLKALSPNRQKETDFASTNQQDFTERISARDMLAVSLYTFLFEWIVSCINKFLMRRLTDMHKCISVLDIPGFGSSENSRLKQPLLCYSYKQLQRFIDYSFFQQEDDRSTPLSEDKNRSASGCFQLMERKFDACLHPQKKSAQRFDASNTNGEIIQNGLYFKEILEFLSLCMPRTIEPLDQRKNAVSGNAFLPNFISTSHSAACWEQFSCIMRNVERTAPHMALCIRPNKSQCAKVFDEHLVLNQLRVSQLLDLLSMAKSGFHIHVSQDDFADRFGILLSNCPSKEDNMLEICIEVLRKFSASPHMYQVGLNRVSFRSGEIEKLENARERFLQGVLCIQKCYRGYKVRCQMHQRRNALMFLQSSVRSWLARREFKHILKLGAENRDSIDDLTDASMKPERDHQEIERKKEDSSAHEVDPYEGQWKERALAAEEILTQKESENTLLQQKLNESDTRVLEYEMKMRSMEEKLKSLDANITSGKDDAVPGESQIQTSIKDTETVHVGQETAALAQRDKSVKGKAPVTRPNPRHSQGNPVKSSELADPSSRSVLDHLTKEFEHRTQIFNDDADFLVEVKSGQTEANFKPEEELRKLKQRFDVWKKDFNVRLQETKGILKKLGKSEATDKSNKSKSTDKSKKTWWGKKVN